LTSIAFPVYRGSGMGRANHVVKQVLLSWVVLGSFAFISPPQVRVISTRRKGLETLKETYNLETAQRNVQEKFEEAYEGLELLGIDETKKNEIIDSVDSLLAPLMVDEIYRSVVEDSAQPLSELLIDTAVNYKDPPHKQLPRLSFRAASVRSLRRNTVKVLLLPTRTVQGVARTSLRAAQAASKAIRRQPDRETYATVGTVGTGRLAVFWRGLRIWTVIMQYGIRDWYLRSRFTNSWDKERVSKARTDVGHDLTKVLVRMGPTFIKLGQLLSSRIDLLDREYTSELSRLQDDVPGFDPDVARRIVERELGAPVDQLFKRWDRKHLAAASLGQVHRAQLSSGEEVVVKVQRQNLNNTFHVDLANLKILAHLANRLDPRSEGAETDWLEVYTEYSRLLWQEIDYENEAANGIRFQKDCAAYDWIKVPDFYLNMTTKSVVVMEYVPGVKISDVEAIEAAGINVKQVAQRSAESYMSQLCRTGFFHCDPHPGNLAVDCENGGKLIYYDFGMMEELPEQTRRCFSNLIFSIFTNDAVKACDALAGMGILKPSADRPVVEAVAKELIDRFLTPYSLDDAEKSWEETLSPEERKKLWRQKRSALGQDIFASKSGMPLVFPPVFTFVYRAFNCLDGIGKGLDKKYDLTKIARPYLFDLVGLRENGGTGILAMNQITRFTTMFMKMVEDLMSKDARKAAAIENALITLKEGEKRLLRRVSESEEQIFSLQKEISSYIKAIVVFTLLSFVATLSMSIAVFTVQPLPSFSMLPPRVIDAAVKFGVLTQTAMRRWLRPAVIVGLSSVAWIVTRRQRVKL